MPAKVISPKEEAKNPNNTNKLELSKLAIGLFE